jgi:hypothetical protein
MEFKCNEKVFISTQLLAVLPPTALKVAAFIVNWQNSPNGVFLYENRFAKTLKMTVDEIRIAVQTLLNLGLIQLIPFEGKRKIEILPDMWQRYYKVPMDKVINHEGYKLAEEVTYDADENKKSSTDISDMSDAELKTLLLRIEASLSERQQMKKCVVNNQEPTDLPF